MAYVVAHPEKLPIEFQLTGTRPDPWTPEVVINRMAGYIMTRNARTEVQRARLAQRVGVGRVADFMRPEPPVPIALPEGLTLADITDDILKLRRMPEARSVSSLGFRVSGDSERRAPTVDRRAPSAAAFALRASASPPEPWRRRERRGSIRPTSAPTTGSSPGA
jgi:penicillin amidase